MLRLLEESQIQLDILIDKYNNPLIQDDAKYAPKLDLYYELIHHLDRKITALKQVIAAEKKLTALTKEVEDKEILD